MRIRTVKPELWTSRDFRSLSDLGRLCFIALISHADDHGRLKTDQVHIAETMLMGNLPAAVGRELALMERLGMVVRYGPGEQFLALVNWPKHQVVDKPRASEIPEPPKFKRGGSANKAEPVFKFVANDRDDSRLARARRIGSDRIGSDRIGSDRTGSDQHSVPPNGTAAGVSFEEVHRHSNSELVAATALVKGSDAVQAVFAAWCASTGKTGRTVLDEKRRRVIKRALELYPLVDVLDAVRGWEQLAHNRGENDRQRPYNDIELLLRDPKHIETFRDAQRGLVVGRAPRTAAELRDEERLREYHEHLRAES